MMRTIACPDGSDLLALAAEGAAPPGVRRHVDACTSCLRRLRRLKAELLQLRSALETPDRPPPARVAPRADSGGD